MRACRWNDLIYGSSNAFLEIDNRLDFLKIESDSQSKI
jgi:hypothetical protein